MSNHVLFILSVITSILVVYNIRMQFIKKILFLYYLAWHAPLFIGLFFPFSSPMELNPVVTCGILCLVHLIVVPGIIYNYKWLCSDYSLTLEKIKLVSHYEFTMNRKYMIRICEVLSYSAILFVFIDLYVLRELSLLSGDIQSNRAIYATTDPTILGYIGLIGSAMALFLLTISYDPRVNRFRLYRIIPFSLISIFYLLSGNRQYLLFGLLLIVIQATFFSNMGFIKHMIKLCRWAFIFLCIMMLFQFMRQTGTKDNQFEFIQSIAQLECTSEYIAESPLVAPLAYLYVYYGIEYQAISLLLSIDNAYFDIPISSMTVPLLYRRVYPVFNLDNPTVVNQRMLDYIEDKTGMAPLFWVTMYSSFYLEAGFCGLILVVILAGIINAQLIRSCLIDSNQYSYIQISVFYSSLIYGIMSPATTDPIFLFLIIFVLFFRINLPSIKSGYVSVCNLANKSL